MCDLRCGCRAGAHHDSAAELHAAGVPSRLGGEPCDERIDSGPMVSRPVQSGNRVIDDVQATRSYQCDGLVEVIELVWPGIGEHEFSGVVMAIGLGA